MDQETLFTSSKWDIIMVLANGKNSPLELARETKTSIANISQQLRMLELANIVKSERVGNRERGQPRLLYSLSGPISYIISVAPHFAEKKQMPLTLHQETIMRIWFVKDISLHYYLEKFFWEIESKLDKIDSIILKYNYSKIQLFIITSFSNLKKEIRSKEIKKSGNESKRIEVNVFSSDQFIDEFSNGKLISQHDEVNVIFDPNLVFEKIRGKVSE